MGLCVPPLGESVGDGCGLCPTVPVGSRREGDVGPLRERCYR